MSQILLTKNNKILLVNHFYRYPLVGLDKYPEYKGDKYDSAQIMAKVDLHNWAKIKFWSDLNHNLKESYESHKKATVAGPFLSGRFHKVLFDTNPFLTEKDGPVNKEKRSKSESEIKAIPFKPSQPPKTVCFP